MFTKGKCNRKDCAYNHNFEVIDLTDGKDDNDEKHVESQTNENPSASVNLAAEVPLDNENDNPSSENDDGFHADFAHDSGFQCNLAMMSTDDLQLTPANDLRPTLVSSFFSFLLTILSVCLLPVTLLLTTTYVCTTALLSLLYCVLCSTFYIFCDITLFIFWMITIPFLSIYSLFHYLFRHNQRHKAFVCTHSNYSNKHLYPIVMDSGCSVAMSGDLSLFDRSSMKSYKSKISMADSKSTIHSSHSGRIFLNGQSIEALYVPSMRQTLLSLGWFLKKGFKVNNDTQGNLDLSLPTDQFYLSFILSNNNLFYLRQTHTA